MTQGGFGAVELVYEMLDSDACFSLESAVEDGLRPSILMSLDDIDMAGYIVINDLLAFQPYSLIRFLLWWTGQSWKEPSPLMWLVPCLERDLVIHNEGTTLTFAIYYKIDSATWSSGCSIREGVGYRLLSIPPGLSEACKTSVLTAIWINAGKRIASNVRTVLLGLTRDESGGFDTENPKVSAAALELLRMMQ